MHLAMVREDFNNGDKEVAGKRQAVAPTEVKCEF